MLGRTGLGVLKTATFVLIAGILAVAAPNPADNPKDVNVVNTPNVQVTNTPSVNVATLPPVSGTVAVTNTPTVNLGNTANVNVTNTPTVQLSGTTTLNVQNSPSAPLIIRDVDNPARSFFQQNTGFVVQDGSFGGTVDLGTVPPGSTLVIEYISLQVRFPGQESMTAVVFQAGSSDSLTFAPVQTVSNTGTDSTWVVSQPVKMYVAANSNMKLFFGRTSSTGNSQFAGVEISGYLVSQ